MSSEETTILEAARRTSDTLGLSRSYPDVVSWKSVIGSGRGSRVVTPHFPFLEGSTLIISPILQRRLDAENWGPILAPSLVFYKRLKGSYNRGALFRFLPGLLLLAGFFVFGFTYKPQLEPSPIFGFIAIGLALLVLGAYSTLRLTRRFVLEADKEAAQAIGTASLVDALRRLEHLRELDASVGNDWPEYGDHPSITKRIANLQSPASDHG